MKRNCNLLNIFIIFLYIGTILIGGGYVVLPILKEQLVDNNNWITEDELLEYYALSQSLPGLIVINISIFIGYKLSGIMGAITAVLGVIFSAFWSIVLLASILFNTNIFTNLSFGFKCIEVAVILLIYSAVKEMWSKSINGFLSLIIFIMALVLLAYFNISPILVIVISVIFGSTAKLLIEYRGGKCK